jgi:hypothetical protein
VPRKSKPSAVDQASIKPPAGGRGLKCLHATVKWPIVVPQADQVITKIELPPYRGPHSPLDLVIVEIIFGCIFEAFHRMSRVAAADVASTSGDKPL